MYFRTPSRYRKGWAISIKISFFLIQQIHSKKVVKHLLGVLITVLRLEFQFGGMM
jgi:hypothetical protein